MTLPSDFREFIECLNAREVEYILLGGYAVVAYGHVRTTGDIDFWVNPTEENAQRVIKARSDFGFRFSNLTTLDFTTSDHVVQLGYPPLRIDIMTSTSGLIFDEAYSRRNDMQIDGLQVKVIGLDDLKKNKREAGRKKDLGDLENLPDE